MSTSEPMSEERLNEVRQFLSWNPPHSQPQSAADLAVIYLIDLLAEVDRQRQEISDAHEMRTREYDYAVANDEMLSKRIRESIAELAAEQATIARLTERVADLDADRDALLDRRHQQRATIARLLPVVEAFLVGATPCGLIDNPECHYDDCDPEWVDTITGSYWQHKPGCLFEQARAALEGEAGQ